MRKRDFMLIHIHDPTDPRIAAYRDIKERDLTGRQGLFIAEGEVVLRTLASSASRCRPLSLLLAEKRVAALHDVIAALPDDAPTYVASQDVLDATAGFALHRGMLGLGQKPEEPVPNVLLDDAPLKAVVLVACGIGNHDNMGGLFRNAAAFGAHAVLLDDQCCDPFYRKAIRVSVGAVLRTPHAVAGDPAAIVDRLQAAGFEVLALTPSAPESLCDARPTGRVAILVGSEGPGLPPSVTARCRAVGIPMSGGFDSLNVAATSAIALHHLTMRR
jgi:tRNA G18 (ribose-2'-O)-methylase SpoU